MYGRPGVAEECFALQQAIGADVNVLLFCGWTGARGIALSREDLEKIIGHVGAWQDRVVGPLRNIRQDMKSLKVESFRARLKTIELEAEQIEQAMLFAHARCIRSADVHHGDAIAHNVNQCVAVATNAVLSEVAAPCLIKAARRKKL